MNVKKSLYAAAVLNGAVIIFEIIGLVLSIYYMKWTMFAYYTQDSNLVALVASVVYEFYAVRKICGKSDIPSWAVVFRYVATCCLTLTFLTVIFVLIPMTGINNAAHLLLDGSMLYVHLICPVLAIVSFLLFERDETVGKRALIAALSPTFIYSIIVVALNIFNKLEGPYPFLLVHKQPVWQSVMWVIIMVGMSFFIAWILWLLKRKILHCVKK